MQHLITILILLLGGCVSGGTRAVSTTAPSFPVLPLDVTTAGMFFDGGTRTVSVRDHSGVEWVVMLPQAAMPDDPTGHRKLVLSRGDTRVGEFSCASPEAERLKASLSEWLRQRYAEEKVLELANRTDFGGETERELHALTVIDVIAGIRIEQMIEANGTLEKQRAEIAQDLLPGLTKLIELQVKPPVEDAEVDAMQELEAKTQILSARWKEFYRTLDAIVRHPPWAP